MIVAGALLSLGWGWVRSGREFGWLEPYVVKRDPTEVAIRKLDKLAALDLPGQGEHERFYVALTSIVRQFVEDRYGVEAPEETTEEFLREIAEKDTFGDRTEKMLKEFLVSADLVKFAKALPTREECDGAMRSARGFVG